MFKKNPILTAYQCIHASEFCMTTLLPSFLLREKGKISLWFNLVLWVWLFLHIKGQFTQVLQGRYTDARPRIQISIYLLKIIKCVPRGNSHVSFIVFHKLRENYPPLVYFIHQIQLFCLFYTFADPPIIV